MTDDQLPDTTTIEEITLIRQLREQLEIRARQMTDAYRTIHGLEERIQQLSKLLEDRSPH